MTLPSRRQVLRGGLGVAGLAALAACTSSPAGPAPAKTFGPPFPASPTSGQRVVTATLTAKQATLDLGGPTVSTWAYGDTAPGSLLRATAGDLLRVTVDNQLPADTTVHWHGIRLRNGADGVPGLTQDPIAPGTAYTYEFTAPDPGTYFFHPHVGVQLDRGLYAPLVIDDPAEPGAYDAEWVIVLDDWVDGTGRTPDDVLAALIADGGPSTGGMGGSMMGHGAMGVAPFGDAGDVSYRTTWSTGASRRPRPCWPRSRGSGCGCGSSTPRPTRSSPWRSVATGSPSRTPTGMPCSPEKPARCTSGWASVTTSV